MIIIIGVYQWVFVLATGQPIKFPTYYTKKSFVKKHLPEIGLKNYKELRTFSENIDLRIFSVIC